MLKCLARNIVFDRVVLPENCDKRTMDQYLPASNLIVQIFPWSNEHQEDFPSFAVADEVEQQARSDGPTEI